jgi:hypothetical protein
MLTFLISFILFTSFYIYLKKEFKIKKKITKSKIKNFKIYLNFKNFCKSIMRN